MNSATSTIYLVRHGETAWSLSGQHTGRTDLPLTPRGDQEALRLASRLAPLAPDRILTSPLQRSHRTCTLAGFTERVEVLDDLVEWNYGDYEGRTTPEIRADRPGWELFRDGCPGGETPEEVAARADRVVARLRALEGRTILFSHGHMICALAARWSNLSLATAGHLKLDTASISALAHHHTRPTISLWNDHPGALRPPSQA